MYDKEKTELEQKSNIAKVFHSEIVLKAKYVLGKSKLEKKIPEASELVKKTNYNAKITEIENKVLSNSGLATNASLTAVENRIPNISSSVNKTDYNAKITKIEKKNLPILIKTNILLLQNLINFL